MLTSPFIHVPQQTMSNVSWISELGYAVNKMKAFQLFKPGRNTYTKDMIMIIGENATAIRTCFQHICITFNLKVFKNFIRANTSDSHLDIKKNTLNL